MSSIAEARRRKLERVIVAAALACDGAFLLWPDPGFRGLALVASATWGLLAASIALRSAAATHLTLMLGLLTLPTFLLGGYEWPWYFVVPLALYAAIVLAVPPLRKSARWLRRGRLDRQTALLTALVVAGSAAGLLGWFFFFKPDVSAFSSQIPKGRIAALIGGAVFALGNAALEEAIWRGVIFSALEEIVTPVGLAVLLQALSFGVQHIEGFPSGAVGVGLASIYGLTLGVLRLYARGMVAPFLAHVCADLTIFLILLKLAGAS